jgi:hypothetical protein
MIGQTDSHHPPVRSPARRRVLGRLDKILERPRAGGIGDVYNASKFLPSDRMRNPRSKNRFVLKAPVASSFQNDNDRPFHDIDRTDNVHMLAVVEFSEGKILKTKTLGSGKSQERSISQSR